MPVLCPTPGNTPTSMPTRQPIKAKLSVSKVSATAKPWIRPSSAVMPGLSRRDPGLPIQQPEKLDLRGWKGHTEQGREGGAHQNGRDQAFQESTERRTVEDDQRGPAQRRRGREEAEPFQE